MNVFCISHVVIVVVTVSQNKPSQARPHTYIADDDDDDVYTVRVVREVHTYIQTYHYLLSTIHYPLSKNQEPRKKYSSPPPFPLTHHIPQILHSIKTLKTLIL